MSVTLVRHEYADGRQRGPQLEMQRCDNGEPHFTLWNENGQECVTFDDGFANDILDALKAVLGGT